MSVLQITPCVLSPKWSEFLEWSARVFDMPVACRFDDQGWGRLAASSPGVTVIDRQHFQDWIDDQKTVVELEIDNVDRALKRAIDQGAKLVDEPLDAEGGRIAAIETPQDVVLFLWQEDRAAEAAEPVVHQGPVQFTVARQIAASAEEVFQAATEAEHQKKFFVDDASADFEEADVVTWTWEEHGDFDLHMLEFRPNEFVSFSWESGAGPYHVKTQFGVTAHGDGARLAITSSGWDPDTRGLKNAFDQCEGWTQFLDHIRFYLERQWQR